MQRNSPVTPPPLYADSDTERRVNEGILNEYDVFVNYVYTHGNYLISEPKFQIFDFAFHNHRILASIVRDLQTTYVRNNDIFHRLKQLQKANRNRTDQAYRRLMTPYIKQQMKRQHLSREQDSPPSRQATSLSKSPSPSPTQPIASTSNQPKQDSPPPMKIIPLPRSPSPLPTPPTRFSPRQSRQRKCYKCHASSHQLRYCPKYRCSNCRKTQPGHTSRNCPDMVYHPDQYDQDYHDDYDPDDNLHRDC